jgi:formylglycine-generating enzyme required for sulfatase activity
VDANYHEAMAYCAWATERDGQLVRYRVITEAEHQLIRSSQDRSDAHRVGHAAEDDVEGGGAGSPASSTPSSPCGPATALVADAAINVDLSMQCSGSDAVAKVGFNVQLAYGSQSPVDALAPSDKGFYDVFGNAWEWGLDHFAAYHGFKVHPYYDDFSAPCFGGECLCSVVSAAGPSAALLLPAGPLFRVHVCPYRDSVTIRARPDAQGCTR